MNKNNIAGSSEMSFSAIKGETGNQMHNHGETVDDVSNTTSKRENPNQMALSDLDLDEIQPLSMMNKQSSNTKRPRTNEQHGS